MLKRSRFFISATLVAVLFASLFILSPVQTRACLAPPPDTLLSLYQKSDLIVVAEITAAKNGETLEDNEYYTSSEIYRNLKVSSTLKGKAPADFVFTQLDFQYKTKPQTEEDGEYEMEEEADLYSPYGYKGYSELRVGERYLFFFVWDGEMRRYDLTDSISATVKLNDYDLEVHKKRLRELRAITKMKKSQIDALTAWFVRLVEEPSTRWDGVLDLRNSFDSLEYRNEYGKTEETEKAEEAKEAEETLLGENFDWTLIAQNMTDAQKERLSNIAFGELQQNPSLLEDFDYYGITGLVARWDKTRLAMYSFNALQGADRTNHEKTKALMSFLVQVTGDQELARIADEYPTSDAAPESETPAEKSEENPREKPEDTLPAIEVKYDLPVKETDDAPKVYNQPAEPTVVPATIESKDEPEAKKLMPAEMREKLFTDFVNRYQLLLANNFEMPEEPEETREPEINQ